MGLPKSTLEYPGLKDQTETRLLTTMLRRKLRFVRQIIRKKESLDINPLFGMVYRLQGRPTKNEVQ